jgi:hypothetical protein
MTYIHQIRTLQIAKEEILKSVEQEDSCVTLTKTQKEKRSEIIMEELKKYNKVIELLKNY